MPLRRRGSFPSMREDFGGEVELFVDFALGEESAVGEVVEAGLGHDDFTCATVEEPFAGVLLHPEREFVPDFAPAQAIGGITGGNFEHREGADLGEVFGFFDDGDLGAEFHVDEACCGGVVGGMDAAKRQDGVQLHTRDGAPVEFECGTRVVGRGGGAGGRAGGGGRGGRGGGGGGGGRRKGRGGAGGRGRAGRRGDDGGGRGGAH